MGDPLIGGDLQWWCSARGVSWSWDWQPYPGVWIFVGSLATAYWWLTQAPASPARRLAGITGLLSVWIALDWPVGALGAGYLASVHAVQFLLLAMVAPPLLLYGLPPSTLVAITRRAALHRAISGLTNPLPTMIAFTLVMVATHAPVVVNSLMVSQPGAFLLDFAWLASGLAFWWPVVCAIPERPRFPPPLRMLYLFFGTIAHQVIAMWLMLARFPVYAPYELAPLFPGLSPRTDQQIAAGVLILLGGSLVLAAISIIFFRWQGIGAERDGADRRAQIRVGATGGAGTADDERMR